MIRQDKDGQDGNAVDPTEDAPIKSKIRHLVDFIKSNPDFVSEVSNPYFGKYEIRKVLSHRGPAHVFLAVDPDLNRSVVLKFLDYSDKETGRSKIVSEGKSFARIDSPNVARCLGIEQVERQSVLVMEYVPGLNLSEYRPEMPQSESHALFVASQIANGLAAVHRGGLLHLDIKPQNVMVTDDNQIKLIDFGLARPISEVSFGQVSGTPSFMAPEVARNEAEKIDARTDIFGIGAILLYLFTGNGPYRAESRTECLHQAAAGAVNLEALDSVPGLSRSTRELVKKCLDPIPRNRFQSTEDLIQALGDTTNRQSRWPLVLATVAFVVLATLAIWYWIPRGSSSASNSGADQTQQVELQAIEPKLQRVLDVIESEGSSKALQVGTPIDHDVVTVGDSNVDDAQAFPSKNGILQLPMESGELVLRTRCKEPRFVALFSLQFRENSVARFVDEAAHVLGEPDVITKTHRFGFTPYWSEGQEYFLILNSKKPFQVEEVEAWLNERLIKNRGVTPKLGVGADIGLKLIPYRVTKP